MKIPPFRDWRIRAKLISVTLLLVFLPLLCVYFLAMNRFGDALRQSAEEDLGHLVKNIYSMCRIQHEMVKTRADVHSLKKEIKSIRVGATGYVYIIDTKGNLIVHPVKEGENIIDTKDSEGFEYIRSMIKEALKLKEGEVGEIRYPWINPELGENRPRQKINKYAYFRPWDWIISAGSYEEEIYRSMHDTERFILLVVLAGVALVVFLTITFSRVLTKPIQDLTDVTAKMAGGDLSQRVSVRSRDEIGVLGSSFNQMIHQLHDYTLNLEKMIEARTEELNNSKEKYREISSFLNSVLDSATEYAIMAVDFYGKIIEFNKGAEKLFGWKKEDVLNKENVGITILSADRERGIQKQMSERARHEGVCELEMDRTRKGGTVFPAQTTITSIKGPSGGVEGFVEIVRDITRRKALERELRETKEFLENIMESSVDGIVTTDLKGKITYLNRAMEEILQCRRADMLGTHISHFYVRGIEQAREIMDLLRAKERAEAYDMLAKGETGQVLSILTSIFLLRDEGDQIIGTAGIFKDVSDQKRLETQLKTAQANLVEASKMRALGELVSGVAHELNNPLMASQTILHVIFKNLHEDCPNRQRLELIQKCNNRIEKIVQHLKEFSRQTKTEFQEIDLNNPIENALMITGQRLLDHNISIVKKLAEGLPRILGDVSQLEQVFLNLISNAIDAMDDVAGNKELMIQSARDQGTQTLTVSVKDTGSGIPQENLDKVFEPFYSTKSVGKGTGLGLSLCFGIVETHGGRIAIKSQLGKGTEVLVTLPVEQTGKE
ncbi:MAG: PAS domain S-box protein [Pseudomonadota bacterium]